MSNPSNPKTPWPRTDRPGRDVQPSVDAFARRLELLGAAPDVVEAFRVNWADPEWPAAERERLLGLSDASLLAELEAIEAEWRHGTLTEDDEAEQARLALEVAAHEVIAEAVPVVLEWVGGDPARAAAALTVESGRDRPRSTLIAALEALGAAS